MKPLMIYILFTFLAAGLLKPAWAGSDWAEHFEDSGISREAAVGPASQEAASGSNNTPGPAVDAAVSNTAALYVNDARTDIVKNMVDLPMSPAALTMTLPNSGGTSVMGVDAAGSE